MEKEEVGGRRRGRRWSDEIRQAERGKRAQMRLGSYSKRRCHQDRQRPQKRPASILGRAQDGRVAGWLAVEAKRSEASVCV
jgi:hypothetical protein